MFSELNWILDNCILFCFEIGVFLFLNNIKIAETAPNTATQAKIIPTIASVPNPLLFLWVFLLPGVSVSSGKTLEFSLSKFTSNILLFILEKVLCKLSESISSSGLQFNI